MRHAEVEGDVYDICERLKELDPRLHIILIEDGEQHAYVIMEHCDDGVERMVFKTKELDPRILDKARELLYVPFEDRLKKIDRENEAYEQAFKEEELDRLYEDFGGPMYNQLEHDGFITRSKSYPKLGIASGGQRAR